MIDVLTLLPSNWLDLVKAFDTNKIKTLESQIIAEKIKAFILDKQDSIIGSRQIQVFLKAVYKNNYNLYKDFHSIPKPIIKEAFSEIKGEIGLRFCEKLDSIFIELLAFRDILQINKFKPINKTRDEGKSDFFIKKYCLEYEAEVKFKMSDQAFHNSITHLIMGYTMLPHAHYLSGKKVIVNIKLSATEINDTNKKRVYKTVKDWCKTNFSNFSDADIDITIKKGTKDILQIECGDTIRCGRVPDIEEVVSILKSHIMKIQEQFQKRNPKRSIGIVMWDTPWNYDFNEENINIALKSIEQGIYKLLENIGYCCDRLYVYPSGLKKSLVFKQKKDN